MIRANTDTEKERHIIFLLIIFAAVILRIYILSLDMNILLDQGLVQDDAFYYYVIAHHIIEQGQSSFDGINLTNGYHPLWQAITLPVFYFSHGNAAVRTILGIASFLDLISIFIFYKILQRVIKNKYVILTGVAILAFHGTIIRTWFNGLETALSIFSLLWLLHQFVCIRQAGTTSLKDHLWLGVIAAISFLSRTDNAIIIFCIFLFLYLPPALSKKEWRYGLTASTVFIALISPWLLWNIIHFGSIVQISGKIRDNTWLTNGMPVERPLLDQLLYGVSSSITPMKIVFEKMFSPTFLKISLGYIYFCLFALSLFFAQRNHLSLRKNLYLFIPFIAGVLVLFLYHTGVRHFVRGWYNATILLIFTLVICLVLDEIKPFAKFHKIQFFIILAAQLILYSPYSYTKSPKEIRLDDRVAIAEWINTNTPPDAIIGAANAGIMGYYSNRTVINLDGVVNERAFDARISNQLQQYIRDAQISYLADHKNSITHLCESNPYYTCIPADNLGRSTQVVRINN